METLTGVDIIIDDRLIESAFGFWYSNNDEKQKRINYERQLKDFEFQQKEIARLTKVVERFRYKATKARMAQSKLKQIERMVKVEEPNKYDLKTFKTNLSKINCFKACTTSFAKPLP